MGALLKGAVWRGEEPVRSVDELMRYVAKKRASIVNAGATIDIGGTLIPAWTDAASQGAIMGLVLAAQINPSLTSVWKGRDGVFYPVDATAIQALGLGIMAFVQAVFTSEATALAAINATPPTITTFAEIEAVAWPANI